MNSPVIKRRSVPMRAEAMLTQSGVHPLLARLFAARGLQQPSDTELALKALLPPDSLLGCQDAAQLLADAIEAQARLLIVADYDCDGATACAVGVRALRAMGADVAYLVPNRFEYGYGLTPEIVDLAARVYADNPPDLIITVDNGIASVDGVQRAQELGIEVLVTDHHLPGDVLPEAAVIVNPNQPGCRFASKNIAGVGVMFYVMLALRAELRTRDWFTQNNVAEPNLGNLLDLVALGTVADVVKLDHNNRILVSQGLARMRSGNCQAGVRALFAAAGRDPQQASTFDIGFGLGPRLNAAGRLSDMSMGIEALITDDSARALEIAQQLDSLNRERRAIEADMQEAAQAQLLEQLQETLDNTADETSARASISLFNAEWHQGVIGILASRIKEKAHRPTLAFAPGNPGEIKGSGRSIPGLHLRDALDLVSKRHPGLLLKFGGHAMAAGLTLREQDFAQFAQAFEQAVQDMIEPAALTRTIETDGELPPSFANLQTARMLQSEIWGQGFPPPVFDGEFTVDKQTLLKDKHLKLRLKQGNATYDAIWFNHAEPLPQRIRAAYRLEANEYMGVANVQLMVEHASAV